jgi:membrane fusion protein, multidrug efflux system
MRWHWPISVLGIVSVAGIVACLHVQASAQATVTPKTANAVNISVARATARNVPVLLSNIGTVQAFQSVLIRARVDGTLNDIDFTEGQTVKPGDLLAQIDPRPYLAILDAAKAKKASDEAALANDKTNEARDSALLKNSFASKQTYDNDVAGVAQLQANIQGDDATIAAAQLNLDFTRITAPIGGRVGLRLVDPGNLIHATDTTGIVNIDQIQPITVLFSLPQDNLPDVQAAMARGVLNVLAYSPDSGALLGQGQLLTIDDEIDQSTGTFRLKAVFPNTNNALWPGQAVSAALQVNVLKNAITLPSRAINRGPDGLYVFVVQPDQTVAMQPVTVEQDNGQVAVIASGLQAGLQVVTDGQSKLQSGTKVVARAAQAGS